jgi:hypothetical protein
MAICGPPVPGWGGEKSKLSRLSTEAVQDANPQPPGTDRRLSAPPVRILQARGCEIYAEQRIHFNARQLC